jgi:methionyl aminopeptidase
MVILKLPDEIERLRTSNGIVAEILTELRERVKPGVTTRELDRLSEALSRKSRVVPAFKGYHGYPFALCTSVNGEVVHGMPSDRPLVSGDILSLDFGVLYKGYYGDAAITVPVGTVSATAQRLMKVTEEGLYDGIEPRFSDASRRPVFRSSGILSDMESAGACMKIRRSPITACGGEGFNSGRAWSWRSSRW